MNWTTSPSSSHTKVIKSIIKPHTAWISDLELIDEKYLISFWRIQSVERKRDEKHEFPFFDARPSCLILVSLRLSLSFSFDLSIINFPCENNSSLLFSPFSIHILYLSSLCLSNKKKYFNFPFSSFFPLSLYVLAPLTLPVFLIHKLFTVSALNLCMQFFKCTFLHFFSLSFFIFQWDFLYSTFLTLLRLRNSFFYSLKKKSSSFFSQICIFYWELL